MDSKTQHTPGPWHVAAGVQIRSAIHQIARVWMMRNGEGKANARLIAAAPELLEALQQAHEALRSGNPEARMNALRDIQFVIAKATGSAS